MNCHLCETGVLRITKRTSFKDKHYHQGIPDPIIPCGPGDTLYARKCTWCEGRVLTVEKIDRLISAPNPEKLEEGRKAASRGHKRTVELFERLAEAGVLEET